MNVLFGFYKKIYKADIVRASPLDSPPKRAINSFKYILFFKLLKKPGK